MLRRHDIIDRVRSSATTVLQTFFAMTGGHVDEHFPALVMRPVRNRRIDTSRPLVSIVVPVYNVEKYLSGTLASIVEQTYGNLEILVIDDGSPDASASIARQWALFDRRIRVISQANQGLGGARNTGVRHANGAYITFADSDDTLFPTAIETMVNSLETSGSDVAIGAMVRRTNGRIWMPRWVQRVHAADRIGVTLAEAPDVLPDAFAWNKLWRRDFFSQSVRAFPTGILYEDQEPSFASFLRSKSFDILAEPVYIWEVRADGSSLSQQKTRIRDLSDRLTVCRRMAQMIPAEAPQHVRDSFFGKIFEFDLLQYVEQVPRVGDDYFDTLCNGIAELVSMSGGGFWTQIPVYHRMLIRCVASHDYSGTLTVLSSRLTDGYGGVLKQLDDHSLVEKPVYLNDLTAPPPDNFFVIDPERLDIGGAVTSITWLDEHRVRIGCQAALVSGLADGSSPHASFSLLNTRTGQEIELPSERYADPFLADGVHSAAADVADSGYIIEIDTETLKFEGREDWQLKAHIPVGSHTISGPIMSVHSDRAAANPGFASWDGERKVIVTQSRYFGLVFRLASPQCVASDVELRERSLEVTVRAVNGKRIAALEISNRRTGQRLRVRPDGYNRYGDAEFSVGVPSLPEHWQIPSNHKWSVKVRFTDRRSANLLLAEGRKRFDSRGGGPTPLSLDCNPYGYLSLSEIPYRMVCNAVAVNQAAGTLTCMGEANVPEDGQLGAMVLTGKGTELVARTTTWDEARTRFTAVFDLAVSDWYGREVSVPHGGYSLRCRVTVPHDPDIRHMQWVTIRDSDVGQLPWRERTAMAQLAVSRTLQTKTLWLKVSNPLTADERGTFNRFRMRTEARARARSEGLLNAVVFEAYHGKQIADSPRALFELLRRTRPDLQLYWSLATTAVSAPEGASPLLRGTSEWYEVTHRAKWLINNANFPADFCKHPEQRYLQTWHGTPMKRIAEDMPPGNLSLGYRLTMRREVRMWDLMLAQNDFSAEVLPQAFWFDRDTLNLGYPRNDLLVLDRDGKRAEQVRADLGIQAGEKVLLYAPTFRDSKKTNGAYDLDIGLDFDALSSRLPPDTRILLRGHSNTAGARSEDLPENVLDVTSYGEISELFLISDVLVTDYSSMLFDFAVTRKPMLFFVPDIEEYESSTRGFYLRFSEICPGEMHRTTAELAEAVSRAFARPEDFRTRSYDAFAERFAPRDDGCATARVLSDLEARGWFRE